MEEKYAQVALVIITNKNKNILYMQQKDETYPAIRWKLHYTFFGGKVEQNEKDIQTLKRELYEELDEKIAKIIFNKSKKIFDFNYSDELITIKYNVFEAIFSDEELKEIEKMPIKEGKGGELIKKENIEDYKIIFSIKKVLEKYLEN